MLKVTRTAFIAIVVCLPIVAGCGGGQQPDAPPANTETASTPPPEPTAPAPKLFGPARPIFTRTDLQPGTGAAAKQGARLRVHYTGWLYDATKADLKGRMFDSSRDRGPFDFVLGKGQVIPGWDHGFEGMKVGGRRRLIIPPDMAYGVEGQGDGIIPPNAALLFEMELLAVQ